MTDSQTFKYIFSLLLLFLDLSVTASKVGFANARLSKMLALSEQMDARTEQTIKLLNRRVQLRIGLQISHLILRFLLAGFAVAVFVPWGQSEILPINIGILILAAVVLSFIEQLVEAQVLREPEIWAFRQTTFTRVFLAIFSPVLLIPLFLSRLFPSEPRRFYSVTEDELKKLLDAGEEEGVLELDERKMISSILQFRDTLAREIMIPRIDVLALNVNTPILDAVDAMLQSGYSRVPVYEEMIDKVLGILYVKDLLHLCREGQYEGALHNKLRPVYFVPETKKVDDLLTEMQDRRTHIAMVVDEYGGVAGLVTLEDIVEELIGEIQDEYDQAEEQVYQEVNEGEFIFQARIDLDDFNEIMESELPKENADTLGGLIYSKVGRVPKSGEVVQTNDILLTVEQVIGRRIRKVRAQHAPRVLETK